MQQPNQMEQMPGQSSPAGEPSPPTGAQAQQGQNPKEKKAQAYIAGILRMMYGKETKAKVLQMLKSGPPEQTIPQTAMIISKQMEQAISQKGQLPPLDIRFAGGLATVTELITIAETGGMFKKGPPSDKEKQQILMESIKAYIIDGVRNKTIDPVELQQTVEPLLGEEQRALGAQFAQERGLPQQPGVHQAMEKYANEKVAKAQKQQRPQGPPPGMLRKMQGGQR